MGVKISQLPAVVTPALTDIFPIVQGGVTYHETVTQLVALLVASGDFATYTPPSIANHIAVFSNTLGNLTSDISPAINAGDIQAGLNASAGHFISYPAGATSGNLKLSAITNSSGNFSTTISNASAILQSQVISIPDAGASTASFILSNSLVGQSVTLTQNAAAPNNRAFQAVNTNNVTTITSGINYGLEGDAVIVGASDGIISGLVGFTTVSGTLSGTSITAGNYSQLDVVGATVNGGLVAALYTGWTGTATPTAMTKTHGVVMNNGTALVLNSQIYLTGDAQYLLELGSATTYYIAAGVSGGSAGDAAHCAAQKVLKIYVNGAAVYIPVFTQNT